MNEKKSHLTIVSPNGAAGIGLALELVKVLDSNAQIKEIARNQVVHIFHSVQSKSLNALFEKFDNVGLDYSTIAPSAKKLFIADMDSTIINCECLDELADFAGLKPQISAITEKAMRGEIDFEAALKERVKMLTGLEESALQKCFDDRIKLNKGAEETLAALQANGIYCSLVSGGFDFFTRRVRQITGFDEDNSNQFIIKNGKLTGEVKMPILGQQAKLDRLNALLEEKNITPEETIAIGDGANDLMMIEKSGLGIAYKAKPVVAQKANARINSGDLKSILWFCGLPLNPNL